MAEADWSLNYKSAIDIADPRAKDLFDRLLAIRKELRNYVAHGAFGKQGEAFTFHSSAGAVPVLMPYRAGNRKFKFGQGFAFDSAAAIAVFDEFMPFLWSGDRAPAEMYILQSDLPVIVTMAADGSYAGAMKSMEAMKELVTHLSHLADQAANMDW